MSFARLLSNSSVAALSFVALALGAASKAQAQIDLTNPDWVITGLDTTNWNGSKLFFTAQVPAGSGFNVAGYADWYSSGVYHGRELFNGTLNSSLVVEFQGFQLVNPSGITLGHYKGSVTPDGASIINGTWHGVSNGATGVWSAIHLPTPGEFCFGTDALCPCANGGSTGHGCANSVNAAGAGLTTTGTPAGNDVVLHGSGMPNDVFCVYLQADGLDQVKVGDGLACISGNGVLLRVKQNVGGASAFPDASDAMTLAQQGGVTIGSGATRYYQTLYRNPNPSFCTAATYNFTSAVAIVW